MEREARSPLRALLASRVTLSSLPPPMREMVDQLDAFGTDYEGAYQVTTGRAFHLVLLALGVPFDEILGVSSAFSPSTPMHDVSSLRMKFPPSSLPLLVSNAPRTPLLQLVDDVVGQVVPAGLPAEARARLAALGTNYEAAYWDDALVTVLILPVFGADAQEWVSWFQGQSPGGVPGTDEALRARWPLDRVLSLAGS